MCIKSASPNYPHGAFARHLEIMHNIGMNLARIRNAKGLTQADLAEMVGLNQSTIQRAEAQHHTAKLATYKMCAEALGVTLSDIFSEDRDPAEAELLKSFRSIPTERQHRVLAILDLVGVDTAGPETETGQTAHS